ncbi:hypothetical protein GCM10010287_59970 [Streptomyces variabilis]|uniref:Uncharacterized protein n=1 Tax=Streptomyces variabilis TaxID=67372 RepID=A0ABQ2U6N7_9ACTN|nr:hypothetical protein GCM10010265_62750 [Streptomyces griseoincarnatus]GGT77728.1 hypothetical protein GCM10010287_59970 [Streptomyces variabilis]
MREGVGEDGAREVGGAGRGSEGVHAEAVSAAAPATKVRRFTGGLPYVGWGTACHGTRGGGPWVGASQGDAGRSVGDPVPAHSRHPAGVASLPRVVFGVPAGQAPGSAGRSAPSAAAAGRAEGPLLGGGREVGPGLRRVVLVRHAAHGIARGSRDGAPDRSLTPLTAARVGRSGGRQGWREGDSTGGRTA